MARRNRVADGISLSVNCPDCGNKIQKPLSWFENKNVLTCDGCDRTIDLNVEPNRSRIQKALDQAARTEAALRGASDKT